jgi:hypothetical protein
MDALNFKLAVQLQLGPRTPPSVLCPWPMARLLPSPSPALLAISVLLPDRSEKTFICDTDWTAHEAETKIQSTYKLTGGRLVRNNVTLKDSIKLDISMEGQLSFIDGISAMPVGHKGTTATISKIWFPLIAFCHPSILSLQPTLVPII